jgi:hypothetical protein
VNQDINNKREQIGNAELVRSRRWSSHYAFEGRQQRPTEGADKLNEPVAGAPINPSKNSKAIRP